MIVSYRDAKRSSRLERMDGPGTSYDDFAGCLRDIARINAATRGHAPTLAWLGRLWSDRSRAAPPLRILDAGSGYGDGLRAIARAARAAGVAVDLVGVDVNPWAARAARSATDPRAPIRYETADLFALADTDFDAIVSSLFVHHLRDDQAVSFLRWMHARARLGWFVNDLHRHVVPYGFIAAATRAFRLHPFVRNDAPLSVARAFRRADWEALLVRAALDGAAPRVRWEPLFRYCVAWER